MQMMLHQLKGDGGMDFRHLNDISPYYEFELIMQNAGSLEALPSPRCCPWHS